MEGGRKEKTFDFKLKYKCYIAGGVWNFTFRFTENTLDFYKENPPPSSKQNSTEYEKRAKIS